MSPDSSSWQAIGRWHWKHMPMKTELAHVKTLITKRSTSPQTLSMYLRGNHLPFQESGISGRFFTTLQARVEFPSATMASILSVQPSCQNMVTLCSTSKATWLSRSASCLCAHWSHTNKLERYCHSNLCHPHMEKLSNVTLQLDNDNQQMCPAYGTDCLHCQSGAMRSRHRKHYRSSPETCRKEHGWCAVNTDHGASLGRRAQLCHVFMNKDFCVWSGLKGRSEIYSLLFIFMTCFSFVTCDTNAKENGEQYKFSLAWCLLTDGCKVWGRGSRGLGEIDVQSLQLGLQRN